MMAAGAPRGRTAAAEVGRRRDAGDEVPRGGPAGDEVARAEVGAPRAATPADLDALVALDAACFDEPWTPAGWRDELTAPDRRWRVVPAPPGDPPGRVGDRGTDGAPALVGVGGLWLAPDAAHVLRLAVAPAWRRRGIAHALLAELVAAAGTAGRDALTLEVAASDAVARRLYGRHGFVTHGRRPRYYRSGEDAVILWRHGPPADDLSTGR